MFFLILPIVLIDVISVVVAVVVEVVVILVVGVVAVVIVHVFVVDRVLVLVPFLPALLFLVQFFVCVFVSVAVVDGSYQLAVG